MSIVHCPLSIVHCPLHLLIAHQTITKQIKHTHTHTHTVYILCLPCSTLNRCRRAIIHGRPSSSLRRCNRLDRRPLSRLCTSSASLSSLLNSLRTHYKSCIHCNRRKHTMFDSDLCCGFLWTHSRLPYWMDIKRIKSPPSIRKTVLWIYTEILPSNQQGVDGRHAVLY